MIQVVVVDDDDDRTSTPSTSRECVTKVDRNVDPNIVMVVVVAADGADDDIGVLPVVGDSENRVGDGVGRLLLLLLLLLFVGDNDVHWD